MKKSNKHILMSYILLQDNKQKTKKNYRIQANVKTQSKEKEREKGSDYYKLKTFFSI